MYVPPKSSGTICHTPLTTTLSKAQDTTCACCLFLFWPFLRNGAWLRCLYNSSPSTCRLLSGQPEPPNLQQAHVLQPLLVGPCHLGILLPDEFPNTLLGSSAGNNIPGTAIDYARALRAPLGLTVPARPLGPPPATPMAQDPISDFTGKSLTFFGVLKYLETDLP